ncbi:hypothetical protein HK101_000867 [Irineochytrium annulatum]|nr:hypothetical protein HK101_000867 [Irineochytrium annulatum]
MASEKRQTDTGEELLCEILRKIGYTCKQGEFVPSELSGEKGLNSLQHACNVDEVLPDEQDDFEKGLVRRLRLHLGSAEPTSGYTDQQQDAIRRFKKEFDFSGSEPIVQSDFASAIMGIIPPTSKIGWTMGQSMTIPLSCLVGNAVGFPDILLACRITGKHKNTCKPIILCGEFKGESLASDAILQVLWAAMCAALTQHVLGFELSAIGIPMFTASSSGMRFLLLTLRQIDGMHQFRVHALDDYTPFNFAVSVSPQENASAIMHLFERFGQYAKDVHEKLLFWSTKITLKAFGLEVDLGGDNYNEEEGPSFADQLIAKLKEIPSEIISTPPA